MGGICNIPQAPLFNNSKASPLVGEAEFHFPQVPLFNNSIASPLVGEAEFQHEERVLEIQVRGNLRTLCILTPHPHL